MKNLLFILLLAVTIFSCKKTNAPAPEPLPPATPAIDTTGTLTINISHVVNNIPLLLSSTSYTNTHADTFKVDLLKYYICNVQLITATGYTYTEAESYYLVNHSNPNSLQLSIKKVPRANYSSVKFLIGVDSLHNVSGAQTGALDPVNAMFWTWNSGYIMAKFEGTSNQSGDPTKKLTFHLGGFYGAYSSVRSVNLSFPNSANVSETHTPIVNTKAEIAQWFANPNIINFATTYAVTTANSSSKAIADNYASMFSITSVIN